MHLKEGFSLDLYLKEVVKRLRRHEAEMARGDISRLEELEQTTDSTILRKWGWISTLTGAFFSFIILPFTIGVVQAFLPEWGSNLLWAIAKVSMGLSLLMLLASIYFTLGLNSN